MTDQLPYPGPEKGECGCGCGAYGALKKPNRAGVRCVRAKCRCASCVGRNNRRKGTTKQRAARQALGISGPSLGADHEENWRGAVRVEVKAGGRMANPVGVRYNSMRDQSDARHAIGDPRPFLAVVMPDGWGKDGIFMGKLSDLVPIAVAIVEELIQKEGYADERRRNRADEGGDSPDRGGNDGLLAANGT